MEEIKVTKTERETIYTIRGNEKFRIVQYGEEEFVVQKLFEEYFIEGWLWWKKTINANEWRRITVKAHPLVMNRYFNNIAETESYKTFEKALKWIEDYSKYPIYH